MNTSQVINVLLAILVGVIIVFLIIYFLDRIDDDTAAHVDRLVHAAVGTMDGGGKLGRFAFR
jgi:capsular polysaccharide biosynthesis protein